MSVLPDVRRLTQAPRAAVTARFIPDEATALGIRVGCDADGSELILVAPMRVPRAVRVQFEAALNEFRAEVIEIIRRENAARTGELAPDAVDAGDTENVS